MKGSSEGTASKVGESQEEDCQESQERRTLNDASGDQGEATASQNWILILGSLKKAVLTKWLDRSHG